MSQNPIPQGNYRPAVRYGNLIYTAGMTPRRNGVLIQSGKIRPDRPLDDYREAIIQAASNALTAARNTLREGERIAQILSLTVYLNATPDYTTHAKVGDIASDWLVEQLQLCARLGHDPDQVAKAVADSAVRRSGSRQDDITVAVLRLDR